MAGSGDAEDGADLGKEAATSSSGGVAAITGDDFADLPYRDLQRLCKERGLKASGKAEELRERLLEASGQEPVAAASSEPSKDAAGSAAKEGEGGGGDGDGKAGDKSAAAAPKKAAAEKADDASEGKDKGSKQGEEASSDEAPGDGKSPAVAFKKPSLEEGKTAVEDEDGGGAESKTPAAFAGAAAGEEGKGSGAEDEKADEKQEEAKTDTVVARVATLWKQFSEGRPELQKADRLALSAAYRAWAKAKESVLELKENEELPPFTDVWLVVSGGKRAELPVARGRERERDRDRERGEKRPRSEGKQWTRAQSLEILARALRSIEAGESRQEAFNASVVTAHLRKVCDKFSLSRSPFHKLQDLLSVAEEDGWLRTKRHRDDLLVVLQNVPAAKKEQDETVLSPEGPEEAVVEDAGDKKPQLAIADKPAEAGVTETDLAIRPEDSAKKSTSPERYNPANKEAAISEAECIRMFDETLQELCSIGFPKELPVNCSVLSTMLRGMFPKIKGKTPFPRFRDLLRAAEKERLVKVQNFKNDVMITWVKYKYRVLPPRSRSRERDRDRRRDRDRERTSASRRRRDDRGRERDRRRASAAAASSRRGRGDRKASSGGRRRGGGHGRRDRREASESYSDEYSDDEYSGSEDEYDYSSSSPPAARRKHDRGSRRSRSRGRRR